MALKATQTPARKSIRLSYQQIRNLTAPEEKKNGVQTFFANVPAYEIVKLETDSNLRDYIAEHNSRKRNSVHRAIRSTMDREADRFINRNSGLTVTCSKIEVDDQKQEVKLTNASLINGAQTQGEILLYRHDVGEDDVPEAESPFHVRLEINVDADDSSVVETAIARNTATPVQSISQAGARGHLDDLQRSLKSEFPNQKIRMSETDADVLETQNILQYARLLMPAEVSGNTTGSEKLRAYKNKAQCLADFSEWYLNQKQDPAAREKYRFTVQIAPVALAEYLYWESHTGWNGQHIWEETKKGGRAVRRDASGQIDWVAPGILFPLMGALSEFVEKVDGKWTIRKPKLFRPREMIDRTVSQFRAHGSDPMAMGRSEPAYDALRIYPSTLVSVLRAASGK
jgi:hypothetical protein